jgi:uncharacterized protein
VHALGHAGELALGMTWQITWALILGFTLSAIVQAVVAPFNGQQSSGRRPA